MHELSLAQAIAEAVMRRSEGRAVARINLRIGHFRQVVPDALTFSWQMITEASELSGSELDIEHVPATAECSACGSVTTLEMPVLVCASCGGQDVKLVTGEEFQVVSFELADA